MKFDSLKQFWEWLTISTGDYAQDYESIKSYMNSKDFNLLTWQQLDIVAFYRLILLKLANEQQELELK